MRRGTRPLLLGAALAAAALTTIGPVSAATTDAKVTQGKIAESAAYPAQVALLLPDEPDPGQAQFCGGTLIAPDWVLTAAHCVWSDAVPLPDVLYGTNNLDGTGTRTTTVNQFVHPAYDPFRHTNDIALLQLAAPVTNPVTPLAYDGMDALEAPNTLATVTGWGAIHEDAQELPIELLEADVPIISDETCSAVYASYSPPMPPPDGVVCAGNATSSDTEQTGPCYGDSGGPLWATGLDGIRRQIGIVSGGGACGFTPGIFTSVEAYIPFIEDTLGLQLASFTDIAGGPHEPNIERITLAAYASGLGGGLYGPGEPVTRGQMATFLVRALQLPPAETGPFTDVAGTRHEADINAVAQAGIVGGFGDGTYRPDELVSRDQMATFLARARGLEPVPTGPFVDIAGNVHEQNINAVAQALIAGGYGDGSYRPFDKVSRGQMATFLARAFLGAH